MSQADWTPSPVTEREGALLRRRVRWMPFNVIGAGVACVGAMGAVMGALSLIEQGAGVGPILLALAAFAALGYLVFWLAAHDNALLQASREPDLIKKEEFGTGVGWLVDLTILQGSAPTGSDRGMLWIEGGRLCFSGDRTSFSLAPNQCAAACRGESPLPGLRRKTRLALDLRTAAGRVSLSWDHADDPLGDARRQAREALDAWAQGRGADEGQFPPTRLGPGAPTPIRLATKALVATVWWGGMVALAVVSWMLAGGAILLFVGLLAWLGSSAFGCSRPFYRWRAWRDLRRAAASPLAPLEERAGARASLHAPPISRHEPAGEDPVEDSREET